MIKHLPLKYLCSMLPSTVNCTDDTGEREPTELKEEKPAPLTGRTPHEPHQLQPSPSWLLPSSHLPVLSAASPSAATAPIVVEALVLPSFFPPFTRQAWKKNGRNERRQLWVTAYDLKPSDVPTTTALTRSCNGGRPPPGEAMREQFSRHPRPDWLLGGRGACTRERRPRQRGQRWRGCEAEGSTKWRRGGGMRRVPCSWGASEFVAAGFRLLSLRVLFSVKSLWPSWVL